MISTATDKDLRDFRQILSEQRKIEFDQWQRREVLSESRMGEAPRLRKTLGRINRAVGNPRRIQRAVQAAVLGTYRSGKAVSAQHGISIATQFLRIFAESARSGISINPSVTVREFYLHQLYLPDRWRSRTRQFPLKKTTDMTDMADGGAPGRARLSFRTSVETLGQPLSVGPWWEGRGALDTLLTDPRKFDILRSRFSNDYRRERLKNAQSGQNETAAGLLSKQASATNPGAIR
jgi:hypothetical protein